MVFSTGLVRCATKVLPVAVAVCMTMGEAGIARAEEADVVLREAGPHADGYVARAALGPAGHDVVLALDGPTDRSEAPEVVLAIVQGGKVISKKQGLSAIAGKQAAKDLGFGGCERRETRAVRFPLSRTVQGLRLSILCAQGEDYFSTKELAIVYRLGAAAPTDVKALERLWAGEADYNLSEMDACTKSRTTSFRLIDEKTLELRSAPRATWSGPAGNQLDRAVARRLKAECRPQGTKAVKAIPLAPAR